MRVDKVNVRIAHLRIAHWGAILRWAILSQSVIRIAHPNHNTFFTLPVWFRVLATDSGWFSMLFTRLIGYTASYSSQFRVYEFYCGIRWSKDIESIIAKLLTLKHHLSNGFELLYVCSHVSHVCVIPMFRLKVHLK